MHSIQRSLRMGSPGAACPLPQHSVEEILLKLPVKSLLRFEAVSKHFNSLISSADFITKHHHNSKSNPSSIFLAGCTVFRCKNLANATSDAPLLEKLDRPSWSQVGGPFWLRTLVGYGNGLLLFRARSGYGYDKNTIFILWNPATKQFKRISFLWNCCLGFGYHSGIQDYKFLQIAGYNCLGVLSLRCGTWRKIQISDLRLDYSWQHKDISVVVVDGVWHGAIRGHGRELMGILSFDLKEDSLAWIDSPIPPGPTDYTVKLGLYDEKVCLFVADLRSGSCHLGVWVMEGKASWRKMFATDLATTGIPAVANCRLRLGGSVQGSRVLLNADSFYDPKIRPRSFVYDLSTNTWNWIEIPTGNAGFHRLDEVHDYVESLVSPEVVCHCLEKSHDYVMCPFSLEIVCKSIF